MRSIPHDVERLIVEVTIEEAIRRSQGSPPGVSPLLYVCKRYKDWAYPCMYRSIYLKTPARIQLLSRALSSSPYLASLVIVLTFPHASAVYREAVNIVPLCHNLTSLAYWSNRPLRSPTLDLSKNTALRRLSLDLRAQMSVESPSPILMHLTHLEILVPSVTWYPIIKSLTNLSHLFLPMSDFDLHNPDIAQLPSYFPPNLRVCILYSFPALMHHELEVAKPLALGEVDPRIVVGFESILSAMTFPYIHRSDHELLLDWTTYNHAPDFWEEAEAIIKSRSTSIGRSP